MLSGKTLRQLATRAACQLQTQSFIRTTTDTTTNITNNVFATNVTRRQQSTSSSETVLEPAITGQNQQQQTQPATTQQDSELQEIRPARPLFYHNQMEWLDERMVRISKPTKNVMQSGTAYTNCWKIEFDSKPRDEYWLMGWTGTTDPVSNLTMSFPTKESAIAFCEKNKLQWFVEEQPERKIRKKSYADNYSWNKRTRTGTK